MNRELFIDGLKGFAILLVILGHVLQYNYGGLESSIAYRIIYSFHMPLFFFLSGYVSKNATVKKCAISLLVPYLFWGVVLCILNDWNISCLFLDPDKVLWFLLILFYCHLFHILIKTYIDSTFYIILIAFLLCVITYLVGKGDVGGLRLYARSLPFFLLGYYTKEYKLLSKLNSSKIRLLCWVFFVLMSPQFTRNGNPLFFSYWNLGIMGRFIFDFAVALFGIFSFFTLFNYIYKKYNIKSLSYIGRKTLAIYALQFFFVGYCGFFFTTYSAIGIFCYSVVVLLLCLFIEKISTYIPYVPLILFGKKRK